MTYPVDGSHSIGYPLMISYLGFLDEDSVCGLSSSKGMAK